jgi:large subunit ribosomal protein L29
MKFKDIQGLSVTELKKKKSSLTQEIVEAKMKNSLGQLSNPLVIRHARKEIARVNTVLTQKLVR